MSQQLPTAIYSKVYRTSFKRFDAALIFLLAIASTCVLGVVLAIVLAIVQAFNIQNMTDFLTYAALAATQFGFIALYFLYCLITRAKPFTAGGIQKPTKLSFLMFTPVFTLLSILLFLWPAEVFEMLLRLIGYGPSLGVKSAGEQIGISLSTVVELILATLIVAVLPAIGEELIFRGIILNALKKKSGILAVVASAGLFSLMHTNPQQTVYQFLLGLLFGYVTLKSRSIFPAMLIHFFNNFFSIIMGAFNLDPTLLLYNINGGQWIIIALAVILPPIGIVGLSIFIDALNKKVKQNIFVRFFIMKILKKPAPDVETFKWVEDILPPIKPEPSDDPNWQAYYDWSYAWQQEGYKRMKYNRDVRDALVFGLGTAITCGIWVVLLFVGILGKSLGVM